MSKYKLIFPNIDDSNIYIDQLIYDKNFNEVLYDGVSLQKMSPPVAILKNLSGSPLDILYSLGGKLVVSEKVKSFLQSLEESIFFEFIKVEFVNKEMAPYYVLNILELIDAFDWEKSEYELFDELGPKGNKVIRDLIKMEVDESKTKGRQLFNLLNFEGDILIHVDLAHKMIAFGITGILLDPLIGHK